MTALQPRYSSEEFARRGTELYDQQVRPQVEKNNTGKVVAIDIETGAFEVADDTITASDLLLAHIHRPRHGLSASGTVGCIGLAREV